MKTKFQKTFTSLLLIAALVFSGISYQGKEAKAADNYTPLFTLDNLMNDDDVILPAGQAVTQNFTVSSNGTITILVYTPVKTNMNLKITASTGTTVHEENITSSDLYWGENTTLIPGYIMYYNGLSWTQPTTGSYTLSLTFEEDMYYIVSAVQGPAVQNQTPSTPVQTPTPSLNAQNVTVTVGFTQTISVSNASDAITWSSNNKSVATVSNGKITGKKAGTATITAKTAGGYTMNCKVTVKKNVYSVKKLGVKKVPYGKTYIDIYNVSYDKKGNLVIKTRVLNNSNYKLSYLKNVKLKIKDNNGKAIGTYSAKTIKKVNLKAGKAKAYTFKIKKSKLKNKKANLPLITTGVSGKAYYIR